MPYSRNKRSTPPRINSSSQARKLLFKSLTGIGALIITLAAVFAVTELYLYLRPPLNKYRQNTSNLGMAVFNEGITKCFADDDALPCRLIPGVYSLKSGQTITINSHGYRGREFSLKKPKGITRILVVGDSMTYGFGMDDNNTIPRLLGKKLRREFNNIELSIPDFTGAPPSSSIFTCEPEATPLILILSS